jgi:hypothetical protein
MPTLIMTAELNDIDLQDWLADVLALTAERLPNRFDDLLPWNWSAHAQSIARVKQLKKELFALGEETMLLEELDGFIAGVAGLPRLDEVQRVAPDHLGPEGKDGNLQAAFDNLDHINRVLGPIMEYHHVR